MGDAVIASRRLIRAAICRTHREIEDVWATWGIRDRRQARVAMGHRGYALDEAAAEQLKMEAVHRLGILEELCE